jgi:hypothetical protein
MALKWRCWVQQSLIGMTHSADQAAPEDIQRLGYLGIFLSLFIKNMIYSCPQYATPWSSGAVGFDRRTNGNAG